MKDLLEELYGTLPKGLWAFYRAGLMAQYQRRIYKAGSNLPWDQCFFVRFDDVEYMTEIAALQQLGDLCDDLNQVQKDFIPFASLYHFRQPLDSREILPWNQESRTEWMQRLNEQWNGLWDDLDRAEAFLALSTDVSDLKVYLWNGNFYSLAPNLNAFLLMLEDYEVFIDQLSLRLATSKTILQEIIS